MDFLEKQIITYMGNKRALLPMIKTAIESLNEDQSIRVVGDLFSGSGICARLLKTIPSVTTIITNDLEHYNKTINQCYLTAQEQVNWTEWDAVVDHLRRMPLTEGIITELYAPADDENIKAGERVFYTHKNAMRIDTWREGIDLYASEEIKPFILAPLLYEASVHVNTAGVFKGFYKNRNTNIGQFGGTSQNALDRIMGEITLNRPPLLERKTKNFSFCCDINTLAPKLPHMDLVYLDPPYNQHPYGSNYFMLNIINDNVRPDEISTVSGIPKNWNRSAYNRKAQVHLSLDQLIQDLDARYILLSYNNEGYMGDEEIIDLLNQYGEVDVFSQEYNTFRGCRNLKDRPIHTQEYLFLLKKGSK